MPRKKQTPEPSLDAPKPAPAEAQPVESPRIEFILHKDTDGEWGPSFELTEAEFDALTQELERLRNIPATSPDPAWLTRGRNAECMRAFDSLLATRGKDIANYQRLVIGAAVLVSDHGEDGIIRPRHSSSRSCEISARRRSASIACRKAWKASRAAGSRSKKR